MERLDIGNGVIEDEILEFQDDEETYQKLRTHSLVQTFKTRMEESHKADLGYSNQDQNMPSSIIQCKNEIIEDLIDKYIEEYGIDKKVWGSLLREFTNRASESVKPHRFILDYEIDVKII